MKKINLKKVLIIFVLIFFIVPILLNLLTYKKFSGYLLFHKPAFRGKVIDAETKKPIEGAVVVAIYNKKVFAVHEMSSSVINAKEALTDKKGKFYFPSYSTIMLGPFSYEHYATFIIYKPGYGRLPHNRIHSLSRVSLDQKETYFLAENFGKPGEIPVRTVGTWNYTKQKVTFGLVELPLLKTRKDRLNAIPGRPTGFRSKELPLLFKAINDERKAFGLIR